MSVEIKKPSAVRNGSQVRVEAVVLGAGFAGLGTAAMLERRGVPTLVVERAAGVGASWRGRYDSLRLASPRSISTLAGYRMPRRYGRYPSRRKLIEYLEDYAERMGLRLRFDSAVEGIERTREGWRVETSTGAIESRFLVVALGYDNNPHLPDWPGQEGFMGELLHAAQYRNPTPYRGRDVLVVSAGHSGTEIAMDMLRGGAARVRIAMRTPPNIFPREWHGIPVTAVLLERLPSRLADAIGRLAQRAIYGDLSEYGLPLPPTGFASNLRTRRVSPVVESGFVEAVKKGELELVAAVEGFVGADVVLADGSAVQPQVVIAATGYRRGLEALVGDLGVLDGDGVPIVDNRVPRSKVAPGLYFVGYQFLLSTQLGLMRIHSRRVANAIAAERRRST